jgi:hypothetical protein
MPPTNPRAPLGFYLLMAAFVAALAGAICGLLL